MLDALNLDITHYDLVKMGSSGPDIVIAPSIQKHFTRVRSSSPRLLIASLLAELER
jgi:DNA polymerase alpha subunit B